MTGIKTLIAPNTASVYAPQRKLHLSGSSFHCRATMLHIRKLKPSSGIGFQVKVLNKFQVVSFSLGSRNDPSGRLFMTNTQAQ